VSHRAFLENDETPMGQLPDLTRRSGGQYYDRFILRFRVMAGPPQAQQGELLLSRF
jgi:hypothetical protein